MEVELYLPGNSILHQADPRLKIGGLVSLGILITAMDSWGLLSITIGLLLLMVYSHMPLKTYQSVMYATFVMGLFYLLILGWNWTESWFFWRGHWSQMGILQALRIIWRIGLVFLFTRIFAGVTSPSEQGIGIAFLLKPFYRLTPKAADFALLITLTLRFIPLLIEEASLLYKARVAKGSYPSSYIKKLMELASFLVPLLLLTLRRSEELAENLVARGYTSGGYRVLGTKEWENRDSWGIVILMVWEIGTLILDNLF
jgi:energy-coupling factor transport system permease protein